MEEKDFMNNLCRRIEGFSVEETTVEYAIDENGVRRPIKEKTQNKYYPPDLSATKLYLELIGMQSEFANMSDADLEREKARLIAELSPPVAAVQKRKPTRKKSES